VESTNAEHTDNQSISPFATPEPHRPTNTHSSQTPKMRFLGMALVVLVSLSAGFIGGLLGRSNGAVTAANTSAQQKIVENESQLVSQIAKDVGQSVV
jgi:hypothetical protein